MIIKLSNGLKLETGQRLTVKALIDIPKDANLPVEERRKGLIKAGSLM
jgi:hypothetical protein